MSEANTLDRQRSSRWSGLRQWVAEHRDSPAVNVVFCLLVPLIVQILLEWVARGTLAGNKQGNGFAQAVFKYFGSFLISYVLLVALYVFICYLVGNHAVATGLVGLMGLLPAVVTQYKLTMRGEPFLPWDLSQIGVFL